LQNLHYYKRTAPRPCGAENDSPRGQIAGASAPLELARSIAVTGPPPVVSQAPTTRPRVLALLKDPALRGGLALMVSAMAAGGLGLMFWSAIARRQDASAVGSVSAEVSSITFLAGVGSLNLINVFARFLPEAGWRARQLILGSYGGAALAGMVAATIFLLTPMATGLVLGGGLGRLAFTACVVLNSIFMIQDGGLVGFGRSTWVPVENILVALARLALLPVTVAFFSPSIGELWSWAAPMAMAVIIVNVLNIGVLAGRQANQQPSLPTYGELGRFVAIESVTTAISSAVSSFLPALVTLEAGAKQGGYFYVPWVIATMLSLLLSGLLISMVREAVARPEQADATILRSMRFGLLVIVAGMTICLLLPKLALLSLGPDFASHGAPLLRWIGLALPAAAVNLLFWATCLVRRRPWPVFAVNFATSGAVVGGILLLGHGASISRVGMAYCIVQWAIAAVVSFPTIRGLRVVRQRKESP
jgi:O-antigen/teichoic acid export membrane protein